MNLTSSQKQNLKFAQINSAVEIIGLEPLVNAFNKQAKQAGTKQIQTQTAKRYLSAGSATNPPFIRFVAEIGKSVF